MSRNTNAGVRCSSCCMAHPACGSCQRAQPVLAQSFRGAGAPQIPVMKQVESKNDVFSPCEKICSGSGLLIAALTVFAGCTASKHLDDVRNEEGTKLTVGTVQKEIKMGMSAAEVAEVLGSPNIVTTDENRQETWIYDKISTEVAYSKSSGTVVGLIFGGSGGGLGAANRSAGATASSHITLTSLSSLTTTSRFATSPIVSRASDAAAVLTAWYHKLPPALPRSCVGGYCHPRAGRLCGNAQDSRGRLAVARKHHRYSYHAEPHVCCPFGGNDLGGCCCGAAGHGVQP